MSERKLRLGRDEDARLRRAAGDHNLSVNDYVRQNIETAAGGPGIVRQMRVWFLDRVLEDLRVQEERIRLQREKFEKEREHLLQPISDHRAASGPTKAHVVLPMFLLSAGDGGLGWLPWAFLALVVIAIFVLARKHPRVPARLRQRVVDYWDAARQFEARQRVKWGPDEGAPVGTRTPISVSRGRPHDEVLREIHQDPRFLRRRVQAFLLQDDGLEKLRETLEESTFAGQPDAVERLRQVAEESVFMGRSDVGLEEVFLLPCTKEQLDEIPYAVRVALLSKRSRQLVPTVAMSAPTVEVAPSANGHAAAPAAPTPTKRPRGRPRKSAASEEADEL